MARPDPFTGRETDIPGYRPSRPGRSQDLELLPQQTLDIAPAASTLAIMIPAPGDSASTPPRLPATAEELLPLVYEELRRLASSRMARQFPGQTLQATALVHEAWMRLGDGRFENRAHFFSAAAQAMRHLLIERARHKLRARHGGGMERVDASEIEIAAPADDERLLQIHEALDELTEMAPDKAEVVKLRFFAGLEETEIAELLGVSLRTVERYWSWSKAWLFDRIRDPAAARGAKSFPGPGG